MASSTLLRTKFLLVTAAFFLLHATTARAQFGPGGGGGPGGWNDDGNSDGQGWNGCGWSYGSDCDDGGDDDSNNGSGSSSSDPSSFNLTPQQLSHTNRVITIHAVLACLVWIFFIPLGGILIRLGIKSPWILRIHALLQSASLVIYIAAVALGVYLVRSLSYGANSMWSDPHTKLGIAILVLAFIQPFLGLVHHSMYKKQVAAVKQGRTQKIPGRTAPGYAHLWLGRSLIVLGMINGGLGLRLAANSPFESNGHTKAIAYGVGAGVMFLLYLAFVIMGERRRSKERKEQENDISRSVPLVSHDAEGVQRSGPVPPTYSHPPSYEDSQDSLTGMGRKEGETTARYS